jgi:hypothetical protein
MAVWALRAGYLGLVIVLVGLVLNASGSTPWVLAAGMFIWLACAIVMVIGFLGTRRDYADSRPGFWQMRVMLLHDTVHARPAAKPS